MDLTPLCASQGVRPDGFARNCTQPQYFCARGKSVLLSFLHPSFFSGFESVTVSILLFPNLTDAQQEHRGSRSLRTGTACASLVIMCYYPYFTLRSEFCMGATVQSHPAVLGPGECHRRRKTRGGFCQGVRVTKIHGENSRLSANAYEKE